MITRDNLFVRKDRTSFSKKLLTEVLRSASKNQRYTVGCLHDWEGRLSVFLGINNG